MRYTSIALAGAMLVLSCNGENLVLPSEGEPAAIAIVQGDGQGGRAGSALADSVVVRVTDTRDRPVSGARVAFVLGVGTAGGHADPDTALTDADGRAAARWTLGSSAGPQQLAANVVGAVNPLSVTFHATAGAGTASALELVKGNGQTGPAGAPLPDSLVVRARDGSGNPVAGVMVSWKATGGGSVSPTSTVTGADGLAATQRTLGGTAGSQGATATASGVAQPVTFTFTAAAGSAARLVIVSGNNQTATAGAQLSSPLVVQVLDQGGNGVPNRRVAWIVGQGGGSANPTSSQTDGSGTASTSWTLGTTAGTNTLTAVVSDIGFVTFTATGTGTTPPPPPPPPPAQPSATQSSVSASPTSFQAGSGSSTITVTVRDANRNPLAGVAVTLAVSGSGNTVNQPAATNAQGVATGSFTSSTAESKTVTVTAGGVTIAQTATVTVTAAPPPPPPPPPEPSATRSTVTASPTSFQAGTGSSTVTVTVKDASGAPLSGIAVTIAVSGSGNTVTQPSAPSNAQGEATGSFTSTTAEIKTVSATAGGVAIVQTATVEVTAPPAPPPSPSVIGMVSGNGQQQTAGKQLKDPLVVQVRKSDGSPAPGVTVAWAVTSGGGTLSDAATTTRNNGRTSVTWTLGPTPGTQTVDASVPGLTGSPVTFAAVALAPKPSDSRSTLSAAPMTIDVGGTSTLTVHVVDADGVPIAGSPVTFTVTGSGASVSPPLPTDASGATSGALTATEVGEKTVSATAGGVLLQQTATVAVISPAPVAAMSVATVPDGVVGQVTQIVVQARDGSGQNVTTGGAAVVVLVTGSNSAGPSAATDNGNGTYAAGYTPALAGTDQVAITLNGQPIQGSPYTSNVAPGPIGAVGPLTHSSSPPGVVRYALLERAPSAPGAGPPGRE